MMGNFASVHPVIQAQLDSCSRHYNKCLYFCSFDFQYYKTHKMVYSIDSMHLNYGHVYYTDFLAVLLVFNSA